MATLASPFETDAPRARFSRQDSRRIANSAQRLRGALTYDVRGNLVTRPASLQAPALSLVWDFDNKLRGADTNGTPATLEVTYEHDALGRRVARSGPSGNVVYVQSGQQTIADYPRGGAPASATYRYVYGSYIDEPLLRETVSGSVRHFFHRNQQYSVTALTDSAGNTAERYAYTAYGALTVFNSSGTPQATSPLNNRYTYTGREWDDSTKLYHFRARWYDPAAGRFVGRDPLGFVDGMGLYGGYFAIAAVDPFGSISWAIPDDEKSIYRWHHIVPRSWVDRIAIQYADELERRGISAQQWIDRSANGWVLHTRWHDKLHYRGKNWIDFLEEKIHTWPSTLDELQAKAIDLAFTSSEYGPFMEKGGVAIDSFTAWNKRSKNWWYGKKWAFNQGRSEYKMMADKAVNTKEFLSKLKSNGRKLTKILGLAILIGANEQALGALNLTCGGCDEEFETFEQAYIKFSKHRTDLNCLDSIDAVTSYFACAGLDQQNTISITFAYSRCSEFP